MNAGTRRRSSLQFAFVAGLAFAGLAHGAEAGRFRILYAERATFDDLAQRADAGTSARAARTRFDAYGRRFDLKLEANDRVLGSAVARGTQAQVWRGALEGIPGSWARMTVANGRRYGMVWDGRDLYVIEPAADARASLVGPAPATGDATIVYRLSDTLAPAEGATCATAEAGADAATTGLQQYTQMLGELRAAAATTADATGTATPATGSVTATQRIQVSAVADFEFVQALGLQGARDRIVARFNNIDGIFASQVGVQVELTTTRLYETPTQPFTATDANALLTEVSAYRQQLAASGLAGGLTHLVTGRNLDGTTVGIAYIGTLCNAKFGASLSEGLASFGDLVAAHEIGHNFGAPHDGDGTAGSATCSAVPQTYLMSPRINGSNQFSQCSLDQIAPNVSRASCLLPAALPPSVDLGVDAPQATLRALVDRAFTVKATVTNAGTLAASNGKLQFTVPAGVNVALATAADGGSCAMQAGGVACAWPTLVPGASTSATLELKSAAAGTYSIVARTVASSDVFASNDSTTYAAVVDPLPDLALDVPTASANAGVDQTTTITAGARNPGATAADGGTLSFELPAIAQAGAALPSGCSIAGSRVTCTLGTVPAGQTVNVSLPVRGLSAGSGTVALALASTDDSSTSNNTGSVALTVAAAATAPAPTTSQSPATAPTANASGGGGGGSFGLLELGALAALLRLRRRARRA